jgi:hypothetical protein
LTADGEDENVDLVSRALQETIRLVSERRYEEASKILNVVEFARPEIAAANDDD